MSTSCLFSKKMVAFVLAAMLVITGCVGCNPQTDVPNAPSDDGGTITTVSTTNDSGTTVTTQEGEESSTTTATGGEGSTVSVTTTTTTAQKVDSSAKIEAAKNKLDFGGKTITIIQEGAPGQRKKGISAAHDRWVDRMDEVEKRFNVKVVYKQGSTTQYNEIIATSILAGDPVGNLIQMNGTPNYGVIMAGALAPLDAAMEETGIDFTDSKYNQLSRQFYNVNGKQYMFGFGVGGLQTTFVYNKRIFKEMKLEDPYELMTKGQWTWDKMLEIANKATKRSSDGTITQYGLAMSSIENAVTSLALNNGTTIAGVDSKGVPIINLNTPQIRETFEFIYQLGSVDKVCLANCDDMPWNAIDQEFAKGYIAMELGTAATINQIYNANMKDDWGMVHVPLGPSGKEHVVLGTIGYNYGIPITYEKDAAKYLLLMDELNKPHEGVTAQDGFRDTWVKKFKDSKSYKLFMEMSLTASKIKLEPVSIFGIYYTNEMSMPGIFGNVYKGKETAGTVASKYQSMYTNILKDKFGLFRITGFENGY